MSHWRMDPSKKSLRFKADGPFWDGNPHSFQYVKIDTPIKTPKGQLKSSSQIDVNLFKIERWRLETTLINRALPKSQMSRSIKIK